MSKAVTIRKHGGDDLYSWAVLVDGRAVLSGLSKREAEYYQRQLRERHNGGSTTA